ncbi:MAG: DUF86 domain-containing protein [Flavobacteriales bacterium]|jgi:uncharacterized protein with HEPN domain|nr:DUF86 domain-containing protein [Flavobacteriales bacterium]
MAEDGLNQERLVHGYDVIDNRIVWKIVTDILPDLLVQLKLLSKP